MQCVILVANCDTALRKEVGECMAEQQRDWWKDDHHEDTSTRRSAPSDGNGYNTDPNDSGGGYDTSPYNTGPADDYNTGTAPEPTYNEPSNNNESSPPAASNDDTGGNDGLDDSPANDSGYDTNPDSNPYDTGLAADDYNADVNDGLDDEPDDDDLSDDGDIDNDGIPDDMEDDTTDSGDDALRNPYGANDSPNGAVLPDYPDENGSESSSDDGGMNGFAGSGDDDSDEVTPTNLDGGDTEDATSPSSSDFGNGAMGTGAENNGLGAGMEPPGAAMMNAPTDHATYGDVGGAESGPLNSMIEDGDPNGEGAEDSSDDESTDASMSPGFESEIDDSDDFAEPMDSPMVDGTDLSGDAAGVGAIGGNDAGMATAVIGAASGKGSASDKVKGVAKEAVKAKVGAFVIANIWWILGIGLVVLTLTSFAIFGALEHYRTILNEEEAAMATNSGSSGTTLDYSNHILSDQVLALEGIVSAELARQGMDNQWTFIVLGMIQQESGGNVANTPDVMQSSESQGWPMNTITDPETSIHFGVMALKNAVDAAGSHGITDVRAILQGYNMNHAFIHWMADNGHDHWTSDIAEYYSMHIVYPSVTGSSSPATAANREKSMSPWAMSIGKPYYIRNGGDFHYPNAILHHLGVDYSGDGPITLNGVNNEMLTEGSLDGYISPIPDGKYQITSNYGPRNMGSGFHKGIDLQYSGAMFHQNGPLYAAADGKVIASGFDPSMGHYVKIDHGPPGSNDVGLDPDVSITTTYMHMVTMPSVRSGMMVKAGAMIGKEGNTGNSFGDHLHFQLEQGGQDFNPRVIYDFPPSVM